MRVILRLIILGLAALGVKTLYDKIVGRSDELEETRTDVLDRTWTTAHDVRERANDAAQHVAAAARASANDVKQAAAENAKSVKRAAADLRDPT